MKADDIGLFAGKISRELFRPVWRHAERRLKPRIDELTRRVDASERRAQALDSLGSYTPAFLSAVRSVRAFGHELANLRHELAGRNGEVAALRGDLATVQQEGVGLRADLNALKAWLEPQLDVVKAELDAQSERIDAKADAAGEQRLWQRIEFVRREIMYEMRHARPDARATTKLEPKIASPDKLQGKDVRLNLGCGHIALDGYVNVDMRDLPGVDVVASIDDIPLQPGSASEIFSSHLVEHFPQEMLRRRLLPYWRNLLKPGGTFRAIAPDGEAMIRAAGAATYDYEDFREVLFGAQDYEGDFHFNLLWPDSFARLLGEAGFEDIGVLARGRRNGKCFEFEIAARKPL